MANITTKQNETSTSSDSKKAKVKKNVKKNGGVKGDYDKKNGKTRYAEVSGTDNLSKNSKDNADGTNSEYRQNNGNTPKTGESMMIILYLGLFLASGVLLVLFDNKFRKQNKR